MLSRLPLPAPSSIHHQVCEENGQGLGSWVTLAPALPGERAPTLGQTSQIWIPAEGPWAQSLGFPHLSS